jgi:GR25 family glycosyltransferase involved in LPS biosynthesis
MSWRIGVIVVVAIVVMLIVAVHLHQRRIADFDYPTFRVYQKHLLELYHPPRGQANIDSLSRVGMYYINLDRSPDRDRYMRDEFGRYDLRPVRIPGVDGRKIIHTSSGVVDGTRFRVHCKISPSELGCTLSHLKAIKKAYTDGHEMALVFEDDVSLELVRHWDVTIEELCGTAGSEWDILHMSAYLRDVRTSSSPLTLHRGAAWSTAAYLIHRRGMRKILDTTTRPGGRIVIDTKKSAVADSFLYNSVHTMIPNRVFFVTFNNLSSMNSVIHSNHNNMHIKYSFLAANRVRLMDMRPPSDQHHRNTYHSGRHDFLLIYTHGGAVGDAVTTKDVVVIHPRFIYSPRALHPFWKFVLDSGAESHKALERCAREFDKHLPGVVTIQDPSGGHGSVFFPGTAAAQSRP